MSRLRKIGRPWDEIVSRLRNYYAEKHKDTRYVMYAIIELTYRRTMKVETSSCSIVSI